jgi:hypothetical protein
MSLKPTRWLALCAGLVCISVTAANAASTSKPNILVIMGDDIG